MAVDNEVLERWRRLDGNEVLVAVSDYAKRDASFVPAKNSATARWHVRAGANEFELLITGAKFWDTRANRGGGGAVDLVMHLHECRFKPALAFLKARGL